MSDDDEDALYAAKIVEAEQTIDAFLAEFLKLGFDFALASPTRTTRGCRRRGVCHITDKDINRIGEIWDDGTFDDTFEFTFKGTETLATFATLNQLGPISNEISFRRGLCELRIIDHRDEEYIYYTWGVDFDTGIFLLFGLDASLREPDMLQKFQDLLNGDMRIAVNVAFTYLSY